VCEEHDVNTIAAEIMEYLHRRPTASDSLDGITHWWLVQQTLMRNIQVVEQALEKLAGEGMVSKSINSNSEAVYRLGPNYISEQE